jgi:diaminopimelate epimerase
MRGALAGRGAGVRFHKYQGLGNDYLILELDELGGAGLAPPVIRRICDRHFGLGSDGILVEDAAPEGSFALRIFNPDGSEAEKSGNGLRIFARYLWDARRVGEAPFSVATKGGLVQCEVRDSGRAVFVEMGSASFDSRQVPVAGPRREVVDEEVFVDGERLRFTAVTVGNPHCVVPVDAVSAELARRLGPVLESHSLFPERTNVQFVQMLDPHRIRIEIWERGAGYTLASGSSSCAAAATSVRLGCCVPGTVTVVMPGGSLEIGVDQGYALTMLGPVGKVAEGVVADEVVAGAG